MNSVSLAWRGTESTERHPLNLACLNSGLVHEIFNEDLKCHDTCYIGIGKLDACLRSCSNAFFTDKIFGMI